MNYELTIIQEGNIFYIEIVYKLNEQHVIANLKCEGKMVTFPKFQNACTVKLHLKYLLQEFKTTDLSKDQYIILLERSLS